MKRLINIFIGFAALVCAASSCQKEEVTVKPEIDSNIVGEWELDSTIADGEEISNVSAYLSINQDGSFELYQQTGSQNLRYVMYKGTCSSKDNILSGTYSDGTPWGDRYSYRLEGDKLILTTYNLIETQTYVKAEIPAEVKENADTKSISDDVTPIL